MLSSNTLKIIVAGDVTVDWYYWPRVSNSKIEDETINWKLYDGLNVQNPNIGVRYNFLMKFFM